MCYLFLFFFFKQKTAYEMRISDWSSDVCSSDLCRGLDGISHATETPGSCLGERPSGSGSVATPPDVAAGRLAAREAYAAGRRPTYVLRQSVRADRKSVV